MFILVYIFHYCGFVVGIFGVAIINLLALNNYQCFKTYSDCYSYSVQFLHIPMIVLGFTCSFISLVILIVFKFKLKLNSGYDKFSLI